MRASVFAILAVVVSSVTGCAPIDDSTLFGPVPVVSTKTPTPAPSTIASTPPVTTPTEVPTPHLCVACDGGACQEADDVCAAVDPEYAAMGCLSGDTMPPKSKCFAYPGTQPTEQQCYVGSNGAPVCEMVQTMTISCCSRL